MDPITLSALIGAGGSLLSGGMSLFGASNQSAAQQRAANQQMALAQRQLEMQLMSDLRNESLTREQLDYERSSGDRSYYTNERRYNQYYDDNKRLNERSYNDSRDAALQAIALAERNRRYAIQQDQRYNETADKQYSDALKASRSGRVDSAGNEVYYDEATNTWKTKVAPGVKALMDASQRIDLEAMVRGGYRREQGEEANFKRRGQAGNEAETLLQQYRDRVGAPDLEGIQGRDTVAGVTRAGAGRDSLIESLSRQLIRSGGGSAQADVARGAIDEAAGDNVRVAIADAAAAAPDKYRGQMATWRSDILNARSPLAAEASNITDAPFASAQTSTSADSFVNGNRVGYNATPGAGGAGVSNAGAQGSAGYTALLNAAKGYSAGSYAPIAAPGVTVPRFGSTTNSGYDNLFRAYGNQPTTQSPWGSAVGGLTENIQALVRRFGNSSGNGIPWNEDSRNPSAYNNWSF